MKTGYAIIAENISKKFSNTLRTSMLYGVKDSVRRLCGRRVSSEELRTGEFWALNRVSFEIRRGEGFAIMGANGSGKTTLLRILAGIFRPDAGQVSLKGRIGALIALGAGFAPTLSGRENIYVNGALLGMRKAEINAKVDEILDFSKVEAGKLVLVEAPFSLPGCIEAAVELLSPRAYEKGLELAWTIDKALDCAALDVAPL